MLQFPGQNRSLCKQSFPPTIPACTWKVLPGNLCIFTHSDFASNFLVLTVLDIQVPIAVPPTSEPSHFVVTLSTLAV